MLEAQWNRQTGCPMHLFSLVVIRKRAKKKNDPDLYCAVEETRNRGFWLPGGFVENGDDHISTAHKETLEEAGMKINLMGILRVESSIGRRGGRQRVIFYAEAKPGEKPKTVADDESVRALWVTLEELREMSKIPPPKGLRGDELLQWAIYLENGGTIYPLSLLVSDEAQPPVI